METDVIIVGGGPAGLATAEEIAKGGKEAVVLEKSPEIGYPIHTSGGSYISHLKVLGIGEDLYHPIGRCRFVSPNKEVSFSYEEPVGCVLNVRNLYQFLAEKAIDAGAKVRVKTLVNEPITENGYVVGVKARDFKGQNLDIRSKIVVDASGFSSVIARKAGLHGPYRRFGVGAEYDLYAPNYDQDEVVLIVGGEVAPAGYAYAFPYGKGRVRIGIALIHPLTKANPKQYLEKLIQNGSKFHLDLRGAEPVEYHFGLLPAEGVCEKFVKDGLLTVGDSAGQPSILFGEGIRYVIKAGKIAGGVAVEAISKGDYSENALLNYKKLWRKEFGRDFDIAFQINREIAGWDDEEWDEFAEKLSGLTPGQFAQFMQTDFSIGSILKVSLKHPSLIKKAANTVIREVFSKG